MELLKVGELVILNICSNHGHQIAIVTDNDDDILYRREGKAPQKRYSGLAQLLTMRRYAPQSDGSYKFVEVEQRWNQVSMQLRPNYPPTFKAMGRVKNVKALNTTTVLTLEDIHQYEVPAYING